MSDLDIKDKIKILDTIARQYNQFSDYSLLWQNIMIVLDCSEKKAKKLALSHCNSVSFYGCCLAEGFINMTYQEYFKKGIDSKYIKENGYIIDKEKLCKALGFDYKLNFATDKWLDIISPLKLDSEKVYQMRICTGRDKLLRKKNHFIMAAIKHGLLVLYDTGNRGIGVSAMKAITEKQFEKLLEV